LDMYLIKLSCRDKIITPTINIVSEETGLSFNSELKNFNFNILKP
jgi:hypothetical protein